MKTEDLLRKSIRKMEQYNDRKTISEGLLVAILNELSEIKKRLPEPEPPKKINLEEYIKKQKVKK